MSSIQSKTCIALAITLISSGCATGPEGKPLSLEKSFNATFASDDPCSNNARNAGVAIGLLTGILLAKATGNSNNKSLLIGAGAGALVGGLIGSDMDRRRCEISKIAKAYDLDIVMSDISFANGAAAPASAADTTETLTDAPTAAAEKPKPAGMSLTIIDRGQQFESGSKKPSEKTLKAFAEVAEKYHTLAVDKQEQSVEIAQFRNKQMRVLLIGHTDDTGSSALNADLSEGRAQAVAEIFAKHGFSKDQLFYQGAGEVFPIASNSTEEGRARNRRVEIVDLSDDATFAAFLQARRPNVAHYRTATENKAQTEVAASAPVVVAKAQVTKTPTSNIAQGKAANMAVAPATASGKKTKPVTVTAAAAPASVAKQVTVTVSALTNLDLGGKPANGQFRNVDIGKTAGTSSFSIISSAYAAADDTPMGSCANDRPRISRGVKSLSTGQVLKTSEYLPGTANASWAGMVNGHLVGLTRVAVLRDGGQPASQPDLWIWKNYVEKTAAKSDLQTTADVNAYQGDKALLYRVFPADGPVRCIDLVIPKGKGAASTAPSSNIVYEHNGTPYQALFSPKITR